MHAWVLVWCGEEAGWCGLDPTNAIAAGDDHVVLAIGRDYADVAPIDGVIFASGGQRLKVVGQRDAGGMTQGRSDFVGRLRRNQTDAERAGR